MTWLYIPHTTTLTSAPAPGCSDSQQESPLAATYEPSLTLSGKHSQRPLSWRGWKTRHWIRRLSGITLPPLQTRSHLNTFADSILCFSLEDSHASLFLAPESGLALRMKEIYGPTLLDSLKRLSQKSYSSKMCPDSFQLELFTTDPTFAPLSTRITMPRRMRRLPKTGGTYWIQPAAYTGDFSKITESPHCYLSSAIWSEWVIGLRRDYSARKRLGQATGANGSSFSQNWTVTGGPNPKNSGETGQDIQAAAANWPTPKGRDPKGQSQRGEFGPMDALPNMASLFSLRGPSIHDGEKSLSDAPTSPRRLNPTFVEWLMGWPPLWTRTDCALPETELSHWRRLMLSSLWRHLYRVTK